MNDTERRKKLTALGLNPDGVSLAPQPKTHTPQKKEDARDPDARDPHAMPVSEIVFDESMISGFPDLSGQGFKHASEHLFAMFKSPHRDPERHALLHRRITEFLGQVRRSRATGGHVREKIRTTAEERDLAQLLASKGLTAEDLARLIGAQEQRC